MTPLVLSRLEMLSTGDPVAELDDDLARLAADLRACRTHGDQATVDRLTTVINQRLDERSTFTTRPLQPPPP